MKKVITNRKNKSTSKLSKTVRFCRYFWCCDVIYILGKINVDVHKQYDNKQLNTLYTVFSKTDYKNIIISMV